VHAQDENKKIKKDSRVLLKHTYICTQQTHPESWDGGV